MRLKDQVCSLELARKLKRLGVKQESLWYYTVESIDGKIELFFCHKDKGEKGYGRKI